MMFICVHLGGGGGEGEGSVVCSSVSPIHTRCVMWTHLGGRGGCSVVCAVMCDSDTCVGVQLNVSAAPLRLLTGEMIHMFLHLPTNMENGCLEPMPF